MEGSDPSNMSTLATIAENVPANSLQKSWNIPKNFKNSSNYSIRIVDEDGESYYGQYFKGTGGKTEVSKKAGKNSAASSKSQQSEKDGNTSKDSAAKQGGRDESKNNSMPLKSSDSESDNKKGKAKAEAVNSAPLSGGSVAAIAYAAAMAAGALAIC
ncbi:hypothetical protein LPJ73_002001 [Coemansia sp. RSA 2703]|nr:hypothetical protein LPJ73_002001 [Coemansia sp. RSA 2703]